MIKLTLPEIPGLTGFSVNVDGEDITNRLAVKEVTVRLGVDGALEATFVCHATHCEVDLLPENVKVVLVEHPDE